MFQTTNQSMNYNRYNQRTWVEEQCPSVSNIFWSLRDDNRAHQSVSYGVPRNKSICSMLGACWEYVGPMLALCWAVLGTLMGPCWAHVGPMLSPSLATSPILGPFEKRAKP